MNNKLIVYGTLKKGHGNHRLMEGAKFLGTVKFPGRMHSCGGFPAVVKSEETECHGEVWEVKEDQWRSLDGLEGHPNWYVREEIETPVGDAWVYYMPPHRMNVESLPVVDTGEWG